MIISPAPNFQQPRKLHPSIQRAALGGALPEEAPPQWKRFRIGVPGGLLGAQNAWRAAKTGQKNSDATGDLLAASLGANQNVALSTAAAKFDPAGEFGGKFLDGLSQVFGSSSGGPAIDSISILVSLSQTLMGIVQEEKDLGTAFAEISISALDVARLVATAYGYGGLSTGLATVAFVVKAGKNVRIVRQA
jgi:hypothetical protein